MTIGLCRAAPKPITLTRGGRRNRRIAKLADHVRGNHEG